MKDNAIRYAREEGLPVLYFILATVVFTWPLLLHMSDSVVDRIGDNVYFVWLFGWFEKALFELGVNPLVVPQLNYPEGWSLAYTELAPATLAIGFPLSLIGGEVLGYNFALLMTFVLSGYFMFVWVRHLTGDWRSGLVAGTLFAFLPYRIAHFRAGHLNLVGTIWLPLFLMGLLEILTGEERERKWIVLSGLSLGLIGLSSIYYLFMTVLISGFASGIYLLIGARVKLRQVAFWKDLLLAGLIALPLLLLAVIPFLTLSSEGGLRDRDVFGVIRGSASLSDFILPATDHFLWGAWVGDTFPRNHWIEGTLYMGVVTLALSIAAWAVWRRDRRHRAVLFFLLLIIGGSFILALGTHLHWMEEIVNVSLPQSLVNLLGKEDIRIRLPSFYLYDIVPMFSKIRVFKRMAIIGLAGLIAMAGLGFYGLILRSKRRWWNAITIGVLVLIFIDFYPGPFERFAKVEARPVDYWLAEQPGDGAVVQFPFLQVEDQDQVYNTLIHGKPFVGGFFNAFPPGQYESIKSVMAGFPDEESVKVLRNLGVEYVIVDSSAYEDFKGIEVDIQQLGLIPGGIFQNEYVFLVSNLVQDH